MSESTEQYGQDLLIRELTQNYAEKLFYFCLKKTGNEHEAEDLTSDILLHLLTALEKGTRPEHFPAWVWKIARNRYSVWADRKHKRAESVVDADVGEFEVEDEGSDPAEALIREDQLRLLRRELSFIAAEYRDIVVAYYMQCRKVSEIALTLGLPEGTVTSRLHRARKILKEGMNMAREFGKRSYQPEEITFSASGYQPSGLPWKAIERKIPVNILCHAHNNPCTLQELALELGVAAPYMEQEVELLVKAELLKKLEGDKYLTSFFISPKECQIALNVMICNFTEEYAAEIWDLAGKAVEKAKELGVALDAYGAQEAQMFFAFRLVEKLENDALPEGVWSKFKRADGGTWGLMGLEHGSVCRLPASDFSNNGNWGGKAFWEGYQALPGDPVFTKRKYVRDVPEDYLITTLAAIAAGTDPATFSETERQNLDRLVKDGYCTVGADGNPQVNALVFPQGTPAKLDEAMRALPEYEDLLDFMRDLVGLCDAIVGHYANPYLKEDFLYYVSMSVGREREIMARFWKDSGLYKGEDAQFCAFLLI